MQGNTILRSCATCTLCSNIRFNRHMLPCYRSWRGRYHMFCYQRTHLFYLLCLLVSKEVHMSCEHCKGYSVSYCPVCGAGEVRTITCPDCNGTGKTPYMAYDLRSRNTYEVSELVWLTLPEDEEEARYNNRHVCRDEEGGYRCPTCHGDGMIPAETDAGC